MANVGSASSRALVGGATATVSRPRPTGNAPAATDAAPDVILMERFKLLDVIGHGGMSVVYSAKDLNFQGQPLVAIKLLGDEFRSDEDAVTALQRECRRVRNMAHDSIVRVYDYHCTGEGRAFISMELLKGEPLDQVIARNPNGLSFADAWPLIRDAAGALAYAHRQDPPFVHYDFKPKNVFRTAEGRIKVLDFGVARAIRSKESDSLTRLYDTAMPGYLTLTYASCEMLAGLDPDPRDDVYALACTCYELLSGVHPFAGQSADIAQTKQMRPRPLAGLKTSQNEALAAGLAFLRKDRTESVDEFLRQLAGGNGHRRDPANPLSWRVPALVLVAAAVLGITLYTLRPNLQKSSTDSGELVNGAAARATYRLLGIALAPHEKDITRSDVLARIKSAPRHVTLGSSAAQIQAAFDLCRHYSKECSLNMYADETARSVTLQPFKMDRTAVTTEQFAQFVAATNYRTHAESVGSAYALQGDVFREVRGGDWRNAAGAKAAAPQDAVVAVDFGDAEQYCRWRQQRLPSEDEWEYAARGPRNNIFPWGDDVSPAAARTPQRPRADAGLAGGIGGLYLGLSGNVWEWVDTTLDGKKVLKGGSWLEENPANKRSAAHRTENQAQADSDTGFRCAESVPAWPDAESYVAKPEA